MDDPGVDEVDETDSEKFGNSCPSDWLSDAPVVVGSVFAFDVAVGSPSLTHWL